MITSVQNKHKRRSKNRTATKIKPNQDLVPQTNLLNLRDQLKKLHLREPDKTNFSMLSNIKVESKQKPGVLGYGLDLADDKANKVKISDFPLKSPKKRLKSIKPKIVDEEQQFHENMVMYK